MPLELNALYTYFKVEARRKWSYLTINLLLNQRRGEELPDSIRMGQRLTGMTANQASFPLQGNRWDFKQHGQSGAWVSDLLPHTSKIVDDLCVSLKAYIPKQLITTPQ